MQESSSITIMDAGYVQILVVHFLSLMVLYDASRGHANAIESPPYTLVLSAPDVEIRQYRESVWISAPISGGTSFNKSTHDGFHRLYQYIHGSNEDNSKVKITSPILTTITPTANGNSDYLVSMYMASSTPSMPSPQLNLRVSDWKSRCIAVRTFSGFAQDDNIYKERSYLVSSLAKSFFLNGKNIYVSEDKSSYAIAQYNSPAHLSGRVNEVWINVLSWPSLR